MAALGSGIGSSRTGASFESAYAATRMVHFCPKEQRHSPLLNLTVNKAQCGRKKSQLVGV